MKYILDKYYQSHPFSSLASADTEREEPGYRVKNYYRNVGALYLRGFVCPDTIIRGIFDDERIDTTTSMGTFGRAKKLRKLKLIKTFMMIGAQESIVRPMIVCEVLSLGA